MGTTYSISLPAATGVDIHQVHEDTEDLLERINNLMSTYINDSELSRLNQSRSDDWFPVSDELYSVLATALAISHTTEGAFDVTIGNLVNLWGFGPGEVKQVIPDTGDINQALAASGYQKIELQSGPRAIKKQRGDIYLDLSGIAKGYAVDRLAEYLEQQDIPDYLVDIGGEIRAKGINHRQQSWRIGIEKPAVDKREVQLVINLNNIAMATSGDYRNFFIEQGKRYSHTIDPRTGRPIAHGLVSVTVLDESAMMADALATALLVMGPDKAATFAEENAISAYFIVTESGQETAIYSTPFTPYLSE